MLLINQSLKDKEYHPNLYIGNKHKDRQINKICYLLPIFLDKRKNIIHHFLPKRRHSYLGVELLTNSISPETANSATWVKNSKIKNKRKNISNLKLKELCKTSWWRGGFRREAITSDKRREKIIDVREMMMKRKIFDEEKKRRRECRCVYIRNNLNACENKVTNNDQLLY